MGQIFSYFVENTEVMNVEGSSKSAKHMSYKKYWETKTGKSFDKCANKDCKQNAAHGGHVYIINNKQYKDNQYIIPLCAKCNNPHNKDSYTIKSGTVCVPL